jgi:hypothetical protein
MTVSEVRTAITRVEKQTLMTRPLGPIVLLAILIGCAAGCMRYVKYDQSFASEYDTVRAAVYQFFEEQDILVDPWENEPGRIDTEAQDFPLEWVDCGEPDSGWTQSDVTGMIGIYLKERYGKISIKVVPAIWRIHSYEDQEKLVMCELSEEVKDSLFAYVEKYCDTQQDKDQEQIP